VIAISVQLEPHVILEVSAEATLQEIRDAYHRQAKKLHPDAGGTAWAFRILAQAYEALSTARVEQAIRSESEADTLRAAASASARSPFAEAASNGQNGAGAVVDASRHVGVEMLWVRYESEPFWLRQDPSREDSSLSCSLNFRWPDPHLAEPVPVALLDVEPVLGQLASVFEALCVKTSVATSRIRVNDDSFSGWLSYLTVEQAAAAYRLLFDELTDRNFAVNPLNRELLIPRTWR